MKSSLSLLIMVLYIGVCGHCLAEHSDLNRLIDDLRSDYVYANATLATYDLYERGDEVIPLLEKALESDDYQQRQLAAEILRGQSSYQPTDRFYHVTVEGLRSDGLPFHQVSADEGRYTYTPCENATHGMEFLLNHIERSEPFLVSCLDAENLQQRFLCAYILAWKRRHVRRETVVSILVEHLASNDIFGDACMSASALYRLGPAIADDLRKELSGGDEQKKRTIQLVLYNFSHSYTPDDRQRKALQVISDLPDPSRHYTTGYKDFGHLWPDW